WLVEAWPSSPGFELRIRTEQGVTATHASIDAFLVIVRIFVGERALCPLLARHLVLFRGKQFTPLLVALDYLLSHDQSPSLARIRELDDRYFDDARGRRLTCLGYLLRASGFSVSDSGHDRSA